MASYNRKDIDRVCRASGMSRARADALLRQYDGRPDRVLEEKCGAVRVYAEPEKVTAPENALLAAWRGALDLCGTAWRQAVAAGQRLLSFPAFPAVMLALIGAPAAVAAAVARLFVRL